MLSLAVELQPKTFAGMADLNKFIKDSLEYLKGARPTAVNIFLACDLINKLTDNLSILGDEGVNAAKTEVIRHIEEMLLKDVEVGISCVLIATYVNTAALRLSLGISLAYKYNKPP